MEYCKTFITLAMLNYKPLEHEKEKASNGYLMSVMAVMAGLPLPIINLLATFLFFILNRRATPFVKWHCTQALVSQLTIFIINSAALTWTIKAFTGSTPFTDKYFAYIIVVVVFNVAEVIVNISAAIRVRKGAIVRWWFWAALADILVRKPASPYHAQ